MNLKPGELITSQQIDGVAADHLESGDSAARETNYRGRGYSIECHDQRHPNLDEWTHDLATELSGPKSNSVTGKTSQYFSGDGGSERL